MGITGRFPSTPDRVRTLLVDLDGTLVQMRRVGLEIVFLFRAMRRFAGIISPLRFRDGFWAAARQMQANDSDRVNHEVFVDGLVRYSRLPRPKVERTVREFIAEDFARLGKLFRPIDGARQTLELARERGFRIVLATNPVWPLEAVRMRLAWGGLGDFPFAHITHSEIMTRCKPRPGYYRQVLEQLGAAAGECVMIGNDPKKDLPAHEVGILTYLVELPQTRRLIRAWADDPRLDGWGSYADLREWIQKGSRNGQ